MSSIKRVVKKKVLPRPEGEKILSRDPAHFTVRVLRRRFRVVNPRLRFSAERKLEFAGNLRPEFAEDVETRVLENAVAHALSCWGESAMVLWMRSEERRVGKECR